MSSFLLGFFHTIVLFQKLYTTGWMHMSNNVLLQCQFLAIYNRIKNYQSRFNIMSYAK